MTRRSLDARIARFALAKPFRIARGVKTEATTLEVRIQEGDCFGWAEAVPYPRYGETPEQALALLEQVRPQIEAGADRDTLASLLPPGAVRNALDCALWHLEAQRRGTPVYALAALPPPEPVETALTISIDTPERMAAEAAQAAAQTLAPLLKIKLDAEMAVERITAVHRAAPAARLILDANESWTPAILQAVCAVAAENGAVLIEQPLPAGADQALVRGQSPVPICADESCHTHDDLAFIAPRYDAVNIKLDKCGGLTEAIALYRAARALDLEVMVGCMVGSSLAMAPAMLLAGFADYVDLDGPLLLAEDRADGLASFGQRLYPPVAALWG